MLFGNRKLSYYWFNRNVSMNLILSIDSMPCACWNLYHSKCTMQCRTIEMESEAPTWVYVLYWIIDKTKLQWRRAISFAGKYWMWNWFMSDFNRSLYFLVKYIIWCLNFILHLKCMPKLVNIINTTLTEHLYVCAYILRHCN